MTGKILNGIGNLYTDNKITVVHKSLLKDENIPSHNHEEFNIFFMVVKGQVEVFLNEIEKYYLEDGDILNFDGNSYISAKGLKDSDIYVYLVRK